MLLRLAKHWMMTALVPSMLTVVRSAVTVSVRLTLKVARDLYGVPLYRGDCSVRSADLEEIVGQVCYV